MFRNKLLLTFLLLLSVQLTFAGESSSEEHVDYCVKLKKAKKRIGEDAKIWHNGGIYSKINQSDLIKWPSEKIKNLSGKNSWNDFKPEIGDIGKIAYVVKSKYKELIYILKIQDYYVPIKCSYIIHPSKLDTNEAYEKGQKDLEAYGKGDCNFKKFGYNDVWNRAGITEMDKLSEAFAFELRAKGISNILFIKQIIDRGYSAYEKMYILWKDNDQGFLKLFENNKRFKPKGKETISFDWDDLIDFYRENKVALEVEKPKSIVSHAPYIIAQFYLENEFFSFGMQVLTSKNDEKLANVQFIREIERKLKISLLKE